MKSPRFWIMGFMWVAAGTFVLLTTAYLFKGDTLEDAVFGALVWAPITAGVFTAVRYNQARKGEACALCRDTVED